MFRMAPPGAGPEKVDIEEEMRKMKISVITNIGIFAAICVALRLNTIEMIHVKATRLIPNGYADRQKFRVIGPSHHHVPQPEEVYYQFMVDGVRKRFNIESFILKDANGKVITKEKYYATLSQPENWVIQGNTNYFNMQVSGEEDEEVEAEAAIGEDEGGGQSIIGEVAEEMPNECVSAIEASTHKTNGATGVADDSGFIEDDGGAADDTPHRWYNVVSRMFCYY